MKVVTHSHWACPRVRIWTSAPRRSKRLSKFQNRRLRRWNSAFNKMKLTMLFNSSKFVILKPGRSLRTSLSSIWLTWEPRLTISAIRSKTTLSSSNSPTGMSGNRLWTSSTLISISWMKLWKAMPIFSKSKLKVTMPSTKTKGPTWKNAPAAKFVSWETKTMMKEDLRVLPRSTWKKMHQKSGWVLQRN